MSLFEETELTKEEAGRCRDRGIAYYSGKGQEQSYRKALRWFKEAAKNGDDVAQYYLGIMYECGSGVKRNLSKALYWYTQAGNRGNLKAQKAAIDIYGGGKTDDPEKMNIWLKKAIKNGDKKAMLAYGRRCEQGKALPDDNGGCGAIRYYEMSETPEGRYYIARLYIFGSCPDVPMNKGRGCEILGEITGVNSSVTAEARKLYEEQLPLISVTEEIQSNLAMARLLQQRVKGGDKEAEAELYGVYYPRLAGVTRTDCGFDRMKFFLNAANEGDLVAAYWYGHQLLKNGDITGGIKFLQSASKSGSVPATKLLIKLYSGENEFSVSKNKARLRELEIRYKAQTEATDS